MAKYGNPYSELVLCIYPILSAHTQQWTHTHTLNTHPEQWAAIYAAVPGDQLGVRCLAQGHLSRGIEGGDKISNRNSLLQVSLQVIDPVSNGTLYVHLQSCRLTMAATCACLLSPWDRWVSHFAAMHPRCTLLPSPHWGELRGRLLPNSQSGITSRKCGLRGRPRWFRVRFGTVPISVWHQSTARAIQKHKESSALQSFSRYFDVIRRSVCAEPMHLFTLNGWHHAFNLSSTNASVSQSDCLMQIPYHWC